MCVKSPSPVSTETGAKVMAGAAGLLKRITLELGGNDAGIVLDDVNPKEAAQKLFDSAFQNSGQVCIAMKRLYVHENIYDEVCDELATIANDTIIGDGSEQGTKLGPLNNKMQYDKVKALIEDAKQEGNVIAGGEFPDKPGYFIRPTIVRDIKEGSRLVMKSSLAQCSRDELCRRKRGGCARKFFCLGPVALSGQRTQSALTHWRSKWTRHRLDQ